MKPASPTIIVLLANEIIFIGFSSYRFKIFSVSAFCVVSEARAEILGGPDKFVKSGSSLRLTCLLKKSTEPPAYVFWYHENRMINYDVGRGVRVRHGRYSSELVVAEAHKNDSGNYSCVPSYTHPASISVHILNGIFPSAW